MILKFSPYSISVDIEQLEEETVFGLFSFFPSPSIKINTGLNREVETSTILHEVLEAVSEIHGLSLDESQIRVLEVSLFRIFQDNPWLLERFRKGPENSIRAFADWPPSQTLPDSPEAL